MRAGRLAAGRVSWVRDFHFRFDVLASSPSCRGFSWISHFATRRIAVARYPSPLAPRPKRCQSVHSVHVGFHCTITRISGKSIPFITAFLLDVEICNSIWHPYHTKCVCCTQSPYLRPVESIGSVLPIICGHRRVEPCNLVLQTLGQECLQMVSCAFGFLRVVKEDNKFIDGNIIPITCVYFRYLGNQELQVTECVGRKCK
jgi:hypothetical protein